MKLVSIIGARPQFIKYAPLSNTLKGRHTDILVHTGQHYDPLLSKIFFDQMHIHSPEYNLKVGSLSHGKQIGMMMTRLEDILVDEDPDFVLVYGDTNSTLAGALTTVKNNIPVAHVEAGIRSFDRSMPEEVNRVVTDHVSSVLFAPTVTAVHHLREEGIRTGVHMVGDIMVDALEQSMQVARDSTILEDIGVTSDNYYLATIHRPSNTDDKQMLHDILRAFSKADKPVVLPLHPRTGHYIRKHQLTLGRNIRVVEPVGYFDFLWLEKNCCKILTDSGGIQKEAYLLGKPCVTLRLNTEWPETVHEGWNLLVGSQMNSIVNAIHFFTPEGKQKHYFGYGHTAEKIVRVLEGYL